MYSSSASVKHACFGIPNMQVDAPPPIPVLVLAVPVVAVVAVVAPPPAPPAPALEPVLCPTVTSPPHEAIGRAPITPLEARMMAIRILRCRASCIGASMDHDEQSFSS